MKLNKNKYIPLGMLFIALSIILNIVSNISDFVIGFLYGASLGILIIGIIMLMEFL